MKRLLSIRFEKLAFYLLGFLVLYLAGAYLGGFFMTLFAVYILLPVLSVLQLLITALSLKYHQEFSTNHPLKGQEVNYTITLSKESIFPSSHVNISFKSSNQIVTDSNFEDIRECPGRDDSFIQVKTIKCPFRGIYTVGLESLEIQDTLRWITVNLPVWYRTFYVYPRIIELSSVQLGLQGTMSHLSGAVSGSVQDYTLFETLKNYRPGEAIRHIAWKKFAAAGEPFLKTYDTTSQPGITLYLDTRRRAPASYQVLAEEDCSVEIAVALVKYFMEREIPVSVHAAYWERYQFSGYDESLFSRFHHNTVNIRFQPGPSPAELFRSDIADNRLTTNSVLFITQMVDPEIIALTENSSDGGISTVVVINLSGYDEEEKEKARQIITSVRDRGGKVFLVNDTESIKEDLE